MHFRRHVTDRLHARPKLMEVAHGAWCRPRALARGPTGRGPRAPSHAVPRRLRAAEVAGIPELADRAEVDLPDVARLGVDGTYAPWLVANLKLDHPQAGYDQRRSPAPATSARRRHTPRRPRPRVRAGRRDHLRAARRRRCAGLANTRAHLLAGDPRTRDLPLTRRTARAPLGNAMIHPVPGFLFAAASSLPAGDRLRARTCGRRRWPAVVGRGILCRTSPATGRARSWA
jgi:hypothetical protein